MTGDLEYLIGIKQIGEQLLLHDAIQTLRDELATPWTTLQTLSLTLSVRCKNYRSELTQQKQKFQDKAKELEAMNHHHGHHHHHHHDHHHHDLKSQGMTNNSMGGKGSSSSNKPRLETIPTTSLASASYLLDAGKVLIKWLTRFPFLEKLNYDEISRKLTKHCFELAMLSQRDTFADNAIEEVQYLCTKIIELCEVLIHSNDSLVIQPAGIDIITLRKRNEQDWGLQFESSYWGLHQITGVKLSSPAQQSGHLERGDEILQVNYQTVLAWPQSSVLGLLHENENEVILTVKRRPRHASTNLLLLGGHQNNMYLNKIPNRKSFFERREKERARDRERVLEKRVLQLMEEERSVAEKRIVEEEYEEVDKKLEHKADARFWKLYPKPKYLIKRRATVTGASPTETRPPVTFINDETSSSPTTNKPGVFEDGTNTVAGRVLHAQVHHRRSTPVTTLTEHDATPIMQLLNPPLVHRPPLDKSRSAPEEDTGVVHEQQETRVIRQNKVVESDDDVFVISPNVLAFVQPPTPKPRLSRSSITDSGDEIKDNNTIKNSIGEHPNRHNQTLEPPVFRERKITLDRMPDVLEQGLIRSKPQVPSRERSGLESSSTSSIRSCTPPTTVEPIRSPPNVPERQKQQPERKNNTTELTPPTVPARKDIEKQAVPPEVPERKTAPQPPERPHKTLERTNEQAVADHPISSSSSPLQIEEEDTKKEEEEAVSILHRGIPHIRSQLRKQSSSNSASALPVVGYGGSTSSIPSALMICSSSPRWIRQNAVFYSNNELEILNPVYRSCSVSSSSHLPFNNNNSKSNSFKVKITKNNYRKNSANEFTVMHATEVHSRPFAFKITSADSITYYLAAESQVELDAWFSVLTMGVVLGGATSISKSLHDRTMLQRALGGLSSTGDSGRRNFARAPYKRSISLGSQSPTVSSTNLSCQNNQITSSAAPTASNSSNVLPTRYGSSTSLNVKSSSPRGGANPETSPTRVLNRSKSSSLKTNWFLRNSSSNISSITITSKKITKSQVTQYPTPNSTPTKQQQQNPMPMMGVAMKTKKNNSNNSSHNSTGGGGGSSSSSPTRKYMCPNCCNVVKVDMSTQTENGNNLKVVFFNEESRV